MIMATGSLLATEHRAADTAPAATEPEAEPITEQAAAEPAARPAGARFRLHPPQRRRRPLGSDRMTTCPCPSRPRLPLGRAHGPPAWPCPRAVDALKQLATEHGVCIRPIALRRTEPPRV